MTDYEPPSLAHLFAPGRLGPMEVANRIVVAPMERAYADADGMVTERMIAHYEALADGGAGLIDVESAFIETTGMNRPHQLGIHDDACVAGLRRLADAVHRQGAKLMIQLQHAGPNSRASVTGAVPVAPSAVPTAYGELPHELSVSEIDALVRRYADAARRACEAGFDAVELHSAHGYLPQAFLSPLTNHRTDDYGRTLAGRIRFGAEVTAALRDTVGPGVAVGTRFSVDECLPGGLTIIETREYAKALVAAGADYLSVSAGTHASFKYVIPPMDVPEGWLLPMAAQIRAVAGVPVVGVGRITTAVRAAEAIADGDVDLVAMGRAFLADPRWPAKARAGRHAEIVSCIGCNQGCMGRIKDGRDVTCLVNPATGRELTFALSAPDRRRRVVVVGGGPAGMEAARVAAERGHEVVLYEREAELGGHARLAGLLPFREGWATFAREGGERLRRSGVVVKLGVEVDATELGNAGADVLIVATGASYGAPTFEGLCATSDVVAVLRSGHAPGTHVLVLGGDAPSLGLCEWLLRQGAHVTLVTEQRALVEPFEQLGLLERLRSHGAFAERVERSLRSIDAESTALLVLSGAIAALAAECIPGVDAVVAAGGRRSDDELARTARALALAPEIHAIGDCDTPRGALEAILAGAQLGRSV